LINQDWSGGMLETDYIGHERVSSGKKSKGSIVELPFITNTPDLKELLRKAKLFAKSEASVLITGESGVGKEVMAKFIHSNSQRRNEPFVAINSCAFPQELFESELFGHEKGAFTGAGALKEGCFELADQGTLFMDEIGEMPLQMQAKVLRAVELKSFRRLGGKREISVDVRIVSSIECSGTLYPALAPQGFRYTGFTGSFPETLQKKI